MDRGSWWATVRGITESNTTLWLRNLSLWRRWLICHLPVGKWGLKQWSYRYLVGVENALCRHWNGQGKEFMARVCSLKSCEPKWGKCRGGSDGKESACNARDLGLILGEGRSSGEENGYPCQYSCLGNAMDRGAWQASVHGVAKSQILLRDCHFH